MQVNLKFFTAKRVAVCGTWPIIRQLRDNRVHNFSNCSNGHPLHTGREMWCSNWMVNFGWNYQKSTLLALRVLSISFIFFTLIVRERLWARCLVKFHSFLSFSSEVFLNLQMLLKRVVTGHLNEGSNQQTRSIWVRLTNVLQLDATPHLKDKIECRNKRASKPFNGRKLSLMHRITVNARERNKMIPKTKKF